MIGWPPARDVSDIVAEAAYREYGAATATCADALTARVDEVLARWVDETGRDA